MFKLVLLANLLAFALVVEGARNRTRRTMKTCPCDSEATIVTSTVDELGFDEDAIYQAVLSMYDEGVCSLRGNRVAPGGCSNGFICESDDRSQRPSSFYDMRIVRRGESKDDQYKGYRMIITNGIPEHCAHCGAGRLNSNLACEQYAALLVPVHDLGIEYSGSYRSVAGPRGISTSGAFVFGESTSSNLVAAISEAENLDACSGHADGMCRYHYHSAPECIVGHNNCKIMGYMRDGGPVYGTCTVELSDGTTMEMNSGYKLKAGGDEEQVVDYEFDASGSTGVLDQANGYRFEQAASAGRQSWAAGEYAYFFTPSFPFAPPGMMSDTSTQNDWCLFDPSDFA